MRDLLSLPVELHQIILDFVEPGDIPSLYSSCKRFQVLVGDRLEEHKQLTDLHRERHNGRSMALGADYSAGRPNQPTESWPCLRRLLLDIEENPRFAWYIQDPLWEQLRDFRDAREGATGESLVQKQIRSSPYISDDRERDDWVKATEQGEAGILLALLLSQLPRIRTVNLGSKPGDPTVKYVARIVSRVAEKSHQGFLEQPLSGLETVHVRHAQWTQTWQEAFMGGTLRSLIALTTLPNLKFLFLHGYSSHSLIDNESGDYSDWMDKLDRLDPYCPLFYGPSKLKSLEVITGCISASVLSVILKNCATLEHFKYRIEDTGEVFGWSSTQEEPSPDYQISSILGTLLSHTRLTLKSLHLEIDGFCPFSSTPTQPPDLHRFTALQRLVLDSDLFGGNPDNWPLFADILPISIKDICILAAEYSRRADNPMIPAMLRGFRPQSFPHLHTFWVWRTRQGADDPTSTGHMIPIYKSTLAEAGFHPSKIHEYHVDSNVFLDRRKAPTEPQYHDGRFSWNIHELPAADTTGHFIMGVHHSEGREPTPVQRWQSVFDGVRVRKSW